MKRLSLLALSALALLSLCLPASSKGGPPSSIITAQVTVHSSGAAIIGDGLENDTYTDGVDGVDCHFGPSTKDLLLQLWPTSRRLNYNMSSMAPDLGPNCGVSPAPNPIPASFSDPSFVGIGSLLDETLFPVGSQGLTTQAWFVTHTIGNVNFTTKYNTSLGFCSLPVLVDHPYSDTWEVYSQSPPNDLAVVIQSKKNQTVPVGYFYLPFHLTVKRLPQ